MPFFVIRGTYHVKGYSPDGDSIRFKAADEGIWGRLAGPPVALNARRHAQLRLEAIDTLETHFSGKHQPLDLGMRALAFLLEALGVSAFETDAQLSLMTEAADGTEGYIVARAVEKNRRPVAFVYSGVPPEEDGEKIYLTAARLKQSVNYGSLAAGLAYPTYYTGLFHDLRAACTSAVHSARHAARGVWGKDCTTSGAVVEAIEDITEEQVIMPKLFRRLVAYLEGGGSVEGFGAYLEALEEEVLIIPSAHHTHFDTIVSVEAHTVRLTELPENLMFEG